MATVAHHALERIPTRASGNSDGLSRTRADTHGQRIDSATNAAIQIVGLPLWVSWMLHGFTRQKAISGHVQGVGRSDTRVHATSATPAIGACVQE